MVKLDSNIKIRIKICGITRPEDAVCAAELGTDAIGLVFYNNSPRVVDIDIAKDIISVVPPFITVVGLFVDLGEESIRSILEKIPLDLLQFHGDETPEECRMYSKPYIKAVRMRDNVELSDITAKYYDASAVLLDAYVDGTVGGTGQQFDRDRIPSTLDKPIILAGGLNPENVAAAIRQAKPYAVDVSGGVESSKGIKDRSKMAAFINEVTNV